METAHAPVLLHEVTEALALAPGAVVLDATAGGGGHAQALCRAVGERGRVIALDRDSDAVARVKRRLAEEPCRADVIQASFAELDSALAELGVTELDGALFDLGMSSDQLEHSGRGFSLRKPSEPLDMRFDTRIEMSAADLIAHADEEGLRVILATYGDEPFARRIARAIVSRRGERAIQTVGDLVAVIDEALPARAKHGRLHFATKTFQALRIAVNDEVAALTAGLERGIAHLKAGGRIAVIAFHELEDRIVKNLFREYERAGTLTRKTKKPLVPSPEEREENPRSRSAKLRIAEKN